MTAVSLLPSSTQWATSLDSVTIDSNSLQLRAKTAIFDAGRSWISVPGADLKAILEAWDKEQRCTARNGVAECLCGQDRKAYEAVKLRLGGLEVTLGSEDLLQPIPASNIGRCLFTIRSEGIEAGWVLGIAFLKHFRTVFNARTETISLTKAEPLASAVQGGIFVLYILISLLITGLFLTIKARKLWSSYGSSLQQPLLGEITR